jgi:endoglucanase
MKLFSSVTKTIAFFIAGIPLVYAQNPNIRLNQVGFYPNATKTAVWVGNKSESFYLVDAISKDTVFKGKLSTQRVNAISQKTTQIADFSAFTKSGKYFLGIPEIGVSSTFEIKTNVHREAGKAALKAFYFQRASTALPEKYAGKWHREAGHPDDKVLIHASAETSQRPGGTLISSSKGWYDAGDYNKYIVNSGITMATLLSLFEDYPDFFKNLDTNIPESGNKIPDLLDETLWNLRWMLTMQDPNDGGVYHKLTNASFDGMVMPEKATKPRYVIQKNTIATLDFAAVMAQASRIFRNYNKKFPGLADSCLNASIKAWKWAKENPKVVYRQNEMNKTFEPDIVTGGYEDKSDEDEWIWAATELYISTKDDNYYKAIERYPNKPFSIPTWNQVELLAYYSLLRNEKKLTDLARNDLPNLKKRLTNFGDELLLGVENQAFNTVMGKSAKDFMWGSSSHAANQGIALLQVYKINADKKYLVAALGNLDYLLGRNATGYSFLTGFGNKQVMFPHHRQSVADGILEPIPGLLSGGPNPGQQDKCDGYPSKIADESFLDVSCSYSTNEIAINWNAPMVYLTAAIEALQKSF